MPDPDGIRGADARYRALLEALDALVAEMAREADAYPREAAWDKVELATRGWRDRLAAVIAAHQERP